jgi:hypothetical protein
MAVSDESGPTGVPSWSSLSTTTGVVEKLNTNVSTICCLASKRSAVQKWPRSADSDSVCSANVIFTVGFFPLRASSNVLAVTGSDICLAGTAAMREEHFKLTVNMDDTTPVFRTPTFASPFLDRLSKFAAVADTISPGDMFRTNEISSAEMYMLTTLF